MSMRFGADLPAKCDSRKRKQFNWERSADTLLLFAGFSRCVSDKRGMMSNCVMKKTQIFGLKKIDPINELDPHRMSRFLKRQTRTSPMELGREKSWRKVVRVLEHIDLLILLVCSSSSWSALSCRNYSWANLHETCPRTSNRCRQKQIMWLFV